MPHTPSSDGFRSLLIFKSVIVGCNNSAFNKVLDDQVLAKKKLMGCQCADL